MTRKNTFFEGWSWFKFNNLGLAVPTDLKLYTSLSKELKLRVKEFSGLILTFVEVTGEKLVGEPFCFPPPSGTGLTCGAVNKNIKSQKSFKDNNGHNIRRLFDTLSNFLFTTSKTKRDY